MEVEWNVYSCRQTVEMKFTIKQRVFIVETIARKNIYRKFARRFRQKYPDSPVPTKSCVNRLLKKWRATGSVSDKKKQSKRTVLTELKVQDIQARLQISPRKSLRRLAQETGVSLGSARTATKLIKFRPYKVTVVHELKQPDHAARIRFCNWLLQNVHDGIVDPQLLFMTDEAWFHVGGHVNAQNVRIWSNENPHAIQQVPLHSEKVGVWCAVSPRRIIGPIFFHHTVNSDRYINDILNPFFDQLNAEERQYGYFQQDNATAHTANASMVAIQEVFEDRIVSRGLWPPRSPDLSICDYYLWGNLKQKVYKNNPRSIDSLQNEITRVIHSITVDELQRVSRNLFVRCAACLQAEGHFQHLL